jgi:excisionase family DNA binding protein
LTQHRYLDGPKLAAWIDAREDNLESRYGGNIARRVFAWRRGQIADIYVADDILTKMGYHLSELPESFFGFQHPNETPDEVRVLALELYQSGLPPSKIEERIGVSRSTITKWRAGAGIPSHLSSLNPEQRAERMEELAARRQARAEFLGTTLSTDEVAEFLGISDRRVRQMVYEGKLKADKTPWGLRYDRDEVVEFGKRYPWAPEVAA